MLRGKEITIWTRQSSLSLVTEQEDAKLSLLDNIYCNNITSVCSSGVVHDDLSDHFPIFLTLVIAELTKMYYSTTPVGDKKGFGKYSMRHNLSLENKSIIEVTPIWCACFCVTVHPKQCIKYSINYLMATSLSKPVSQRQSWRTQKLTTLENQAQVIRVFCLCLIQDFQP